MTETPTAPLRVAISYSWTSEPYKAWVLQLAERLVDVGIDVMLDVWEFDFGDDTIHYMERYVNDPTISKVLLVSDRVYAQKADDREGGVGIESQIISPTIYGQTKSTRFIPVVAETDEAGRPYLPTFLRGRWYVDLSSADTYEQNFAELVRSVYGKPLLKKRQLGKRPSYLDDEGESTLATVYKARTLIDAVVNNKPTTAGMLVDYLSVLNDALHKDLKPVERHLHPSDIADLVRQKAGTFLPYKSEFLEVMTQTSRYGAIHHMSVQDALHEFFVGLVPLMRPDKSTEPFYDPGRFVTYELFLSCIAVLLKHNKFDEAGYLLEQEYLDPDLAQRYASLGQGLSNFNVLDGYLRSFELESRQGGSFNPMATFLFERLKDDVKLLTIDDLVNADVALYCRGFSTATASQRWWCRTLSPNFGVSPTPIFRKAAAKSFFERFKRVLNVDSPQALQSLLTSLADRGKLESLLTYRMGPYESHALLFALDDLASR